jgi:hypothetical protein
LGKVHAISSVTMTANRARPSTGLPSVRASRSCSRRSRHLARIRFASGSWAVYVGNVWTTCSS